MSAKSLNELRKQIIDTLVEGSSTDKILDKIVDKLAKDEKGVDKDSDEDGKDSDEDGETDGKDDSDDSDEDGKDSDEDDSDKNDIGSGVKNKAFVKEDVLHSLMNRDKEEFKGVVESLLKRKVMVKIDSMIEGK